MRDVLCDPNYVYHYNTMIPYLNKHPQIDYRVSTKCVAVTDHSVTVEKNGKSEILTADSIVFATGLTPNRKLVEEAARFRDRFLSDRRLRERHVHPRCNKSRLFRSDEYSLTAKEQKTSLCCSA